MFYLISILSFLTILPQGKDHNFFSESEKAHGGELMLNILIDLG